MRTQALAPLALAFGLAAAQAQPIYRCGDSYGSQPCPGGRPIAAEAPVPTADERRQAAAATQRDARLAETLEKGRLQQEAAPAQLYWRPPKPAAAPAPHKWPEKNATRKLDVFTATAPGSKPPKKEKAGKAKGEKDRPAPAGTLAASPAR